MYDNGTKETIRNWTWNRIAEFIPKSARREKIAAYLSGPEDFDRAVAMSKGFRNENLIAIDKNPAAVESVRKKGGLAISIPLHDAVLLQTATLHFDVLLADMMGGIAAPLKLMATQYLLQSDVVLAVNMKRGRDPMGGEMSRNLSRTSKLRRQIIDCFSVDKSVKTIAKHRGLLLISSIAANYASIHAEQEGRNLRDVEASELLPWLKSLTPVIATYRSKDDVALFDLVVCRSPHVSLGDVPWGWFARKFGKDRPRAMKIGRQRMAALQAVRTKRIMERSR